MLSLIFKKKTMNKIYALLVCLLLMASSCKDPCKDVNCNNGACLEGTCLCDDGYEGVNCDKEERDKFVGSWLGEIDCGEQLGENEASFIVEKDPSNTSGLLFSLDFELLDLEPLAGTVAGDIFFITASDQSIEILGTLIPVTVGGDGEFNDDGTVTMNIAITTAFGVFNCSGILNPQ